MTEIYVHGIRFIEPSKLYEANERIKELQDKINHLEMQNSEWLGLEKESRSMWQKNKELQAKYDKALVALGNLESNGISYTDGWFGVSDYARQVLIELGEM